MSDNASLGALSEIRRARTVLPEADVLLNYVAFESRSIASPILYDIVQTVVRARHAVEAGTLDTELARSVLQSVATLRVLAAPATAETITATRTVRPWTLTLPPTIVAGLTFVLSVLASINAAQQTALLRLIDKQNAAAVELYLGSQAVTGVASGPGQTVNPSVLAALKDFSTSNRALAEQTRAVRRWLEVTGLDGGTSAAVTEPSVLLSIEPGQAGEVIRSQIEAFQQIRAAAVDAVQTNSALAGPASSFVLPGLFGLLGSMVFGLRKDMAAIRTSTLAPRRRALSRDVLGVVAGVTIGLFTSASKSTSETASLSPLAVAFLAGYSLEILFAGLDSIVAMVTRALPMGGVASASAAVLVTQQTQGNAPSDSPARTRVAELAVLTRAVNESVISIFAPPAFIAYSGTLGVDIIDESGASAVTAHGQDAVVLFPRAGTYRVTVWFVPDAAPPQGAAQVPLKVEGGPPPEGGSVPFELRADLGFATTPLRRQEVTVDPRTSSRIDLGVLQVAADGLPDGPIRPNYPISVAVYQHGQRCTTCVIVPAPNG